MERRIYQCDECGLISDHAGECDAGCRVNYRQWPAVGKFYADELGVYRLRLSSVRPKPAQS